MAKMTTAARPNGTAFVSRSVQLTADRAAEALQKAVRKEAASPAHRTVVAQQLDPAAMDVHVKPVLVIPTAIAAKLRGTPFASLCVPTSAVDAVGAAETPPAVSETAKRRHPVDAGVPQIASILETAVMTHASPAEPVKAVKKKGGEIPIVVWAIATHKPLEAVGVHRIAWTLGIAVPTHVRSAGPAKAAEKQGVELTQIAAMAIATDKRLEDAGAMPPVFLLEIAVRTRADSAEHATMEAARQGVARIQIVARPAAVGKLREAATATPPVSIMEIVAPMRALSVAPAKTQGEILEGDSLAAEAMIPTVVPATAVGRPLEDATVIPHVPTMVIVAPMPVLSAAPAEGAPSVFSPSSIPFRIPAALAYSAP